MEHSDDEYSDTVKSSLEIAVKIPQNAQAKINMQQIMGSDGEIEIDQDFDDENVEVIQPLFRLVAGNTFDKDVAKNILMSDLPSSRSKWSDN
jgi:hypothetical protein